MDNHRDPDASFVHFDAELFHTTVFRSETLLVPEKISGIGEETTPPSVSNLHDTSRAGWPMG